MPAIRTAGKTARAVTAASLHATVMAMAARQAAVTRISMATALAISDRLEPCHSIFILPETPGPFVLRVKQKLSSGRASWCAARAGRGDARACWRRFRRAELGVLAMWGPQGMR